MSKYDETTTYHYSLLTFAKNVLPNESFESSEFIMTPIMKSQHVQLETISVIRNIAGFVLDPSGATPIANQH